MKRTNLRKIITSVMAAGLLVAVLVPAAAAAPPRWTISVSQQAAFITAGAAQAFDITIVNRGPSNISSLYLIASPDDTGEHFVTDDPLYITSSRADVCGTTGDGVLCSFGAVSKGTTLTVTVAYAFPLASGAKDIYFGLNTTGLVLGENNSHGDAAFSAKQSVNVVAAGDLNRGGRFTTLAGQTVFNSTALSRSNVQATKLANLAAFVAATVEDGSGVPLTCSKQKCPGKQIGEWSEVHVGQGLPQAAPFTVEITILGSAISGRPDPASVFVYHLLDNGNLEVINQCTGGPLPSAGCVTAAYVDGNLVLTITTNKNGGFKGAF